MSRHAEHNNHANQLNPNNDAYWQCRGYDGRPDEWEELVDRSEANPANAASTRQREMKER